MLLLVWLSLFVTPGSAQQGAQSSAHAHKTMPSNGDHSMSHQQDASGTHQHELTGLPAVTRDQDVLAPGYFDLNYDPPKPGTYQLPPMGQAANGTLINTNNKKLQLHDLLGDKLVLLSFIYTQCNDVNGCPLATFVMSNVQNDVLKDPDLRNQVRLISISFDFEHDTPKRLKIYRQPFLSAHSDWQFLTTSSAQALYPLLESFGQRIKRDTDLNGNHSGTISHILRVFLIDKEKQLRNIYSTSFLHQQTVINDLQTLLIETVDDASAASTDDVRMPKNLDTIDLIQTQAGDYKQGYERKDYTTQNQSLSNRDGTEFDLYTNLRTQHNGLPLIDKKLRQSITPEKIILGKKLFFDRRLSHNNTISCAMCHIPEQGFTSNEMATAIGIEGRTVKRNAPTIYNVAFVEKLFHDGRESSLERQVWVPLLRQNEMANPSLGFVIDKISGLDDYQGLFEQAFDGESVDIQNLGEAIASYERSLLSANSNFDKWQFGNQQNAVDDSAKRGFDIFGGKGRCIACHQVDSDHAFFTDNLFHNTGIGFKNSMRGSAGQPKQVLVAPGTYLTLNDDVVAESSEPRPNDLGLYEVTENPDDRWKYKTPTLRNLALTAPYMHDGSLSTLAAVIEFYNDGGIGNDLLDPLIQPLDLNAQEKIDLENFLQSLTGDNINELVLDAFATPIGNHGNLE